MVDNIEFIFDGYYQGILTNPCVLIDLIAGKNQLAVEKKKLKNQLTSRYKITKLPHLFILDQPVVIQSSERYL